MPPGGGAACQHPRCRPLPLVLAASPLPLAVAGLGAPRRGTAWGCHLGRSACCRWVATRTFFRREESVAEPPSVVLLGPSRPPEVPFVALIVRSEGSKDLTHSRSTPPGGGAGGLPQHQPDHRGSVRNPPGRSRPAESPTLAATSTRPHRHQPPSRPPCVFPAASEPEPTPARQPPPTPRTATRSTPRPELGRQDDLTATRAAAPFPQSPAEHFAIRAAPLHQTLLAARALVNHDHGIDRHGRLSSLGL